MGKEETASAPAAEPTIGGMSRRAFAAGCVGAAAALALGGMKAIPAQALVRPPGGQDESVLLGACIHCEKCYEACPRHVIAPATFEDGILNMRVPKMDFRSDYCDFCAEENGGMPKCVATCPTKALQLPAGATAENTIIGVAEITTDWCLAYRRMFCRSCYDACPYEAITLNDSSCPVVHADLCNGCGACEAVCISMQAGSIAVGENHRAIIVVPVE